MSDPSTVFYPENILRRSNVSYAVGNLIPTEPQGPSQSIANARNVNMGDIVSASDATNLHQDSIRNRGEYITRLPAQEGGPAIPSIRPRPALELSTLVPNLQAPRRTGTRALGVNIRNTDTSSTSRRQLRAISAPPSTRNNNNNNNPGAERVSSLPRGGAAPPNLNQNIPPPSMRLPSTRLPPMDAPPMDAPRLEASEHERFVNLYATILKETLKDMNASLKDMNTSFHENLKEMNATLRDSLKNMSQVQLEYYKSIRDESRRQQ
ncbi:hypothetical protein AKO1_007509 [Acrasis kona]|uniref:Uncharacterized protein n=1 Tax=Acrasis kona TaxID=1008807 RepID=A0AAW2YRZ5_9EUKA